MTAAIATVLSKILIQCCHGKLLARPKLHVCMLNDDLHSCNFGNHGSYKNSKVIKFVVPMLLHERVVPNINTSQMPHQL